jgi:two-component system sensor histidine kinase NreB
MDILPTREKINTYIMDSHEDEIKRIALELHEGVGQTLYSVLTGMQLIESSIENPSMKSYAKEMEQLLEKTIQEIRFLSVELHPPTLVTLGIVPALKNYIKLYTHTYGIEVDLLSTGIMEELTEKQNIALFRACQEAFVNIAKYADTLKIRIAFEWNESCLKVKIEDYGRGFDVPDAMKKSLGLAAMTERMLLIGGSCSVHSEEGTGTTVEFTVPY